MFVFLQRDAVDEAVRVTSELVTAQLDDVDGNQIQPRDNEDQGQDVDHDWLSVTELPVWDTDDTLS